VRVRQGEVEVKTQGRGFVDLTDKVGAWLAEQRVQAGVVTAFVLHTSASLVVQENADPDVRADLERFFARLIPDSLEYAHREEGPDDLPAHVRAALTATSVSMPVRDGRLQLGTWQALWLAEHRVAGSTRRVSLTFVGTGP
jgi:secondary thiamine-phosphate synthase enzyme